MAGELSPEQVDMRLGRMGLKPGLSDEPVEETRGDNAESEQQESEESDERDTVDASEQESADEEEEEASDAGDEEETDEGEQEPTGEVTLALQAKKDAEERERKLQSRLDKQEARHQREIQRFYGELQGLKNQLTAPSGEPEIPDDEMVDGKTLKAIVKQQVEKFTNASNANGRQQAQTSWVNSQRDSGEIMAYIRENDLLDDPEFSGLQTDNVGLYFAVKNRMLEDRLDAKEAEYKANLDKELGKLKKQIKAKETKPKVPPTGGDSAGSRPKGNASEAPVSDFERKFMGWANSRGMNPTIAKVNR